MQIAGVIRGFIDEKRGEGVRNTPNTFRTVFVWVLKQS